MVVFGLVVKVMISDIHRASACTYFPSKVIYPSMSIYIDSLAIEAILSGKISMALFLL